MLDLTSFIFLEVAFVATLIMAFWIRKNEKYDFLWFIHWNFIPSSNQKELLKKITSAQILLAVYSMAFFLVVYQTDIYHLTASMIYLMSLGAFGIYIFVLNQYYQKRR